MPTRTCSATQQLPKPKTHSLHLVIQKSHEQSAGTAEFWRVVLQLWRTPCCLPVLEVLGRGGAFCPTFILAKLQSSGKQKTPSQENRCEGIEQSKHGRERGLQGLLCCGGWCSRAVWHWKIPPPSMESPPQVEI